MEHRGSARVIFATGNSQLAFLAELRKKIAIGVVGGSDSDFIALGAPYVDLFSLKFRGVDLVFKVYEPETVSQCTVQKHGPRARSLGTRD